MDYLDEHHCNVQVIILPSFVLNEPNLTQYVAITPSRRPCIAICGCDNFICMADGNIPTTSSALVRQIGPSFDIHWCFIYSRRGPLGRHGQQISRPLGGRKRTALLRCIHNCMGMDNAQIVVLYGVDDETKNRIDSVNYAR